LRDLPFVTNLSKFYDEDIINSDYNNIIQSKNVNSNGNILTNINSRIAF